jgi:hypothetical protein
MKSKLSITVIVITVLLTFSYLIPFCLSQNYSSSYQLLNEPDGSTVYGLNVTVQQLLYEYYRGQTHTLSSDQDFAKFVTPYALEPIADSLWEIYRDDEDFANGVLMIAHQIPYEVTEPAKYPVETIVENKGDCDLLSFIAASIMRAGGLNVVLLYYKDKAHMNVGVSLSHTPQDARSKVYYVTYNNIKYYIAECTGGDWRDGWRVGEYPDKLKGASAKVITLENCDCEGGSPEQVSASYETLAYSTISLIISPTYLVQGGTVTLSGQLSPPLQNRTVTIDIKINNSPWIVLDTITTNHGYFTYAWNTEATGICYIRSS